MMFCFKSLHLRSIDLKLSHHSNHYSITSDVKENIKEVIQKRVNSTLDSEDEFTRNNEELKLGLYAFLVKTKNKNFRKRETALVEKDAL